MVLGVFKLKKKIKYIFTDIVSWGESKEFSLILLEQLVFNYN